MVGGNAADAGCCGRVLCDFKPHWGDGWRLGPKLPGLSVFLGGILHTERKWMHRSGEPQGRERPHLGRIEERMGIDPLEQLAAKNF